MEQILRQVGQAFVQAIPTVIFVGLLVLILDRLFFRPLSSVLRAREDATAGARERARQGAARAEAKTQEYEAAWQKARQEIYWIRDTDRQAALAGRNFVLREARERAESMVREAQEALTTDSEAARGELGSTSRTLAEEIARAVLGAPEPRGGEGGFSR